MNEIAIKFLFGGDKFMLNKHLREPEFTYSAYGPFTRKKKKRKNTKI